jgi:hypothetical protein
MKKKIVILLTIVTLLMTGTAFADGKKAPPLNSDIEIQTLQAAPDSELVLDEVTLIKSKKGKGDAVRFEYNVEPDSCESSREADIELIVDPEKGTYKAKIRCFVPAEVKERTKLPPAM